ncbi:MAG: carbonic anhydrase [Deltaproteobacteria bacterium]|jgi:carbonic anhydrase|nr:carbonic anhydrase [Deltaproteobacteria bacterium]
MMTHTVSFVGFLTAILCLIAIMIPLVALVAVPAMASHANPNTAESTITALRDGNARFVASAATHPNESKELLKELADHGQTPMAAVLACSDSRVPIEKIFDLGFGDLFVIRAAGAVPGVDQIGSLEYAVAHLGVPVVLVLSHTNCGAISAAVGGAQEPGALGELLKKLNPVAKAVEGLDQGLKLQKAVELSASIFREQLPLASAVLAEAAKNGKLQIISGVYDIATGKVTLKVANN